MPQWMCLCDNSHRASGLGQKKNFGLIWQAVFKLEYLFCQERQDASLRLREPSKMSQRTIFLGNFENKNLYWHKVFGKYFLLVKI